MTRLNPMAAGGSTAVLDAPPQPVTCHPSPIAPVKGGLKRVSFAGLAPKKADTKTAYPVLPDADGKAAEIAARILERTEQFEALKGALETDKAELKFMVAPHYFTVNHGRHEVPSSVAVNSPAGEVLVTFQNRYSQLPDESGLMPVLGDRLGDFFRQSFELKIKGDKLPEASTQELMNDLQALFAKYNCADALELKEGIKPVAEFRSHLPASLPGR